MGCSGLLFQPSWVLTSIRLKQAEIGKAGVVHETAHFSQVHRQSVIACVKPVMEDTNPKLPGKWHGNLSKGRNESAEHLPGFGRINGKRVTGMDHNRTRKGMTLLAGVVLMAGMAGCFRVHVDKDANGEDKNVQVDTPFGGIHVNTDQTSAADLGLPVYPGAQAVKGDDKHKSADVHLGFGEWELRVRAVSYETPDSQAQVTAFYKKALGKYGDVITCQGHNAMGSPAATSQGLTCADDGNSKNVKIDHNDYGTSDDSLELKAGSKRHQHIVGFEDNKETQTHFALVALDLPAAMDKNSDKSD
jgi:hypothetical protein